MRRLPAFLLLSLACTALGACEGVRETYGDIFKVQEVAAEVAASDQVNVNLRNGTELTISVINSPLNDSDRDARERAADRIAYLAVDVFDEREQLKDIYVIFSRHERKYLVVDFTETIDRFDYRARALRDNAANLP